MQQSQVPWFTVIVRKSFGVAAGVHLGPGGRVVAWPSAQSGALPLEGGVALAHRKEIEAAEDPDAKRRELEAGYAAAQSIFPRAEDFGVHDLIDPRETRPACATGSTRSSRASPRCAGRARTARDPRSRTLSDRVTLEIARTASPTSS